MQQGTAGRGTYLIETLGCKTNAYDSRRLVEALEALGFRPVERGQEPDVCLLNTCTVTGTADRKSRKLAARLARKHPRARVYVTGCYATASPDELAAVRGVAGVYGRDEWSGLLEAVHGGPPPASWGTPGGDFGIHSFGGRVRAFLKVQDGCDAFCSYCILPRVRGGPRSRPPADVRAEAERLVAAGFPELVLTGIRLGLYGCDQDGVTLAGIVREVAAVPDLGRLRLSSLEPMEVDEELLEAMGHPAVCAHLHLPLQSGDATVLRRMNRPYTPERFLSSVELARRRLERPAITTDVIAGFPGETEAQFDNTMALCRAAGFSRMHVFPFSPRPGTPAAEMPDHVPGRVVRERVRRLTALAVELAADWAEGFVGRRVRVLFETRRATGRLSAYTDRYVRVFAPGGADLVGRTAHVLCAKRDGARLHGRIVRDTGGRED